MPKTPFIRPLQVQGGTFYSFSSSEEDISTSFNNSDNKFKFSKFALLNIPDIDNSSNTLNNKIKLNAPDGAFLDWAESAGVIITGNGNIDFSQSFQSYCLNLESTILSSDEYNPDPKKNISERVFFKWLKELGAIRFKNATDQEVSDSLDQNTVTVVDGIPITEKRFTEGDPTEGPGSIGLAGANYENVVKYIGNLDIVNSVKNNSNTYSEVYVYVPVKDGSTPTILFKNNTDLNYLQDFSWQNLPIDPLDREYLSGRSFDEVNPSGLTSLAIFDCDVLGAPEVEIMDTIDGSTGAGGNWYTPRDNANTYYTDRIFTEPASEIITKTHNGNSVTYARTRLDSIGIDFDPLSYKEINENLSISTIEEFNSVPAAKDFEFNAVLIYYDVYNPANPTEDYATNLFGVLFLDDVKTDGDTYIPRFKKFKPNPITKLNGNSWGFKINIKFESDIDQTAVEQAINDYSPFSLSMFMDAMNVLQDASSALNNYTNSIISIEERVSNLENLILSTSTSVNLEKRIQFIEESLIANQALFNNSKRIVHLINENYNLIKAIINNETSAKITYDLDSIKSGIGININRNIENQISIENSRQEFNIDEENNGLITLFSGIPTIIELKEFSNYYKYENNGFPITLTSDLSIRIDDSINKWKRGQKFRFVFGDEIYPENYLINFYTDAVGNYPKSNPTSTQYSKHLFTLDQEIFEETSYKPVIEIICIDETEYKFQIDLIGRSLINNI